METLPTALDLFKRFVPRFSEVQLVPAGWGKRANSEFRRMYLTLRRPDGSHINFQIYPAWIDVVESALEIDFHYDRSKEQSLYEQFTSHVIGLVETQLLSGRRFRFLPEAGITSLRNEDGRTLRQLPVKIEVDGEPIPGLHHTAGIEVLWTDVIPMNSPEASAIFAASQVEYLSGVQPRDIEAERATVRERLLESLRTLSPA